MRALTRPRRLVPGDRVAVVAPSGPVPRDRLAAGLDVLRGWGLDPVVAPHVHAGHGRLGYLSAADRERAADLERAWCDPAVAAVLCARGGYGAQRMVDLLDWDALRAAGPKVLVGFSDITALHEAFALRLGLVTLHGPMPAAADFLASARARDHLHATLFAPESTRTVRGLPGVAPLVPGRTSGVTFGGCLALLAAGLATPTGRSSGRGGLLCVEDTGEDPYRLDRNLTQLLRSGLLDGVAGVLLGSWAECGPYAEVRAVLADRLGTLGVPVVERFGFGHCADAVTLPLGVRAELDASAGELRLAEPALRG
ncbi:LD-carboxypeptidase [Streptomyces sp. B-S-A8]|uniref:LD-carboxypeptidase n=1 Tax=Streptomyces solicavernae TaxID=3043614 RepID=A0ABT6RLJ9_9ACTN|nr:LD-carboxypeptidase [Streptomyces sp. B-S-A8]MDI3385311.1 LD-carboxypeptidase [Streptomyces sp. B-S-A8]